MVSGLYGVRARYVEKKEGEFDGKKYKGSPPLRDDVLPGRDWQRDLPGNRRGPRRAEARRRRRRDENCLADARAARANWDHFPGFTADVEVNLDGPVTKGKVKVDARGKVELEMADGDAAKWAKGTAQLDHRPPAQRRRPRTRLVPSPTT